MQLIFITLILYSSVLHAAGPQLKPFQVTLELSKSLQHISYQEQAWNRVMDLLNYEGKIKDPTLSLAHYMELPDKKQKELQKTIPKLAWLNKLVDAEKFKDNNKRIEEKILLLKTHLDKKPNDLKEIIRSYHYSQQELNADLLDTLIGINYEQMEKNISSSGYKYEIGVRWPKNSTQTFYHEIKEMFKHHPPKSHDIVYDLGSGYGRVLFYGAALFPDTSFRGVEIVKERVMETENIAKQRKFPNVAFIHKDVLEVDLSEGTYFYLFNPFPDILDEVIEKLHKVAMKKKILIIVTGRTGEDLKKVSWLRTLKVYDTRRKLTVFESKYLPVRR